MFQALCSVVLRASSRLASSFTKVVRRKRWFNKARQSSLRRRLLIIFLIYEKWTAELKINLTAIAVQCIVNELRWNPLNEILCMTTLPVFSQFLWNLKSIFSCSHENLFFGVISYSYVHLLPLKSVKKNAILGLGTMLTFLSTKN